MGLTPHAVVVGLLWSSSGLGLLWSCLTGWEITGAGTSLCRGPVCSSQPFHRRAAMAPQLCPASPVTLGLCPILPCVSAWGHVPTQLLCVCRGHSSGVGIRSPRVRGEKGMSCPCFHPGVGGSEPLGWSLLLSQSSPSPWRGAWGEQGHGWALLFPVVSPVPRAAAAAAMCWVCQCTAGSGPSWPCPLRVSPC